MLLIDLFILIDWGMLAQKYYFIRKFELIPKSKRTEFQLPYNPKLKPIVIDGCSFTYGHAIEVYESFGYKLQQKTKRKVYNYGISNNGIQHVLYRVQHMPLTNDNQEPEYLIYTYINDHLRRFLTDHDFYSWTVKRSIYKVKGNHLVLRTEEVTPFDYLKMTHLWQNFAYKRFNMMSFDQKFDIFEIYAREIQSSLQKKYPHAKFVILVYHPFVVDPHKEEIQTTDRWKELEKDGIIVIRLDSQKYKFLADKEYLSEMDKIHPSGKAWDTIVPIVIERLGL